MGQNSIKGIHSWEQEHTESCVALAMKNGEAIHDCRRRLLGEELFHAAYPYWQENLKAAIENRGENSFVVMDGEAVEAFCAYHYSGAVARITLLEGESREPLEALLAYVIRDMKKKGVTHCAVDCDTAPGAEQLQQALNAVGFRKNLPHVRYFQTLKPGQELPETELRIVPAEEEHIGQCVEIAVKLWTIIHGAYAKLIGDDIHDVTGANWQAALRVNIANQQRSGNGLVALLDGRVVGFCGARMENGLLGVIGYNGVDPEYRGRGIARYMYEAAFDRFRSHGISHARVFTGGDDGHGPARRAYEKAGFDRKLLNVTYYMKLTETNE